MAIEIVMPKLSDTMEEGKILKWLKNVGDKIEMGDIIAEVETDKADMEMEALDAGILAEIRVREGESIAVGGVIAILSEDGVGVTVGASPSKSEGVKLAVSVPPSVVEVEEKEKPIAEAPMPLPQASGVQALPIPERKVRELREPRPRRESHEATGDGERVLASPLVKRMAEEHHIDLGQVSGSGPNGRIIKQDIEAYLAKAPAQPSSTRASVGEPTPAPVVTPMVTSGGTKQTFSRMRATIAKRMADSMREVPHFYVTCEVDMSEAVRLRTALKASDRVQSDVTYTHFLIKAVAIALERHPRLNAAFAEDGRELKAEINIGIAVSLEDGLIVPVLHHCNKLSLLDIASQGNALVERARSGKPAGDDLSGGTFTISNMGMLPIEHFTAIINQPQGAILAVGAIKERPVVRNGQVVIAHTMMVTLSSDHRILDGVTSGQFLTEVKKLLENPVGLMV
ncbi:MAG: 2-oxo acid dehydrogenase subunit E2 [Deltaproteobacteria bacterium]|nr:2-oxo acid dehydrogenase subunit E2 [Deltaproteobacteria bacterium]